ARAHFGPIPIGRVELSIDLPQIRWMREQMREHGTFHVHDIRAQNDFSLGDFVGDWRTWLAVPLCQQEEVIGHLGARVLEVRPFKSAQIKLLETFAAQAVIALENVRLFQELKEALEQQTATSEILGVIASSPTDIQPVLNTVATNAARLCNAVDALIYRANDETLRVVAHYGEIPIPVDAGTLPVDRNTVGGRAVVDRQTLHINDVAVVPESELPSRPARRRGTRTMLATPLLRENTALGVILLRRERDEVRPFSEKQIQLLKTFADQAVIAIENVRLFKELQDRNRGLTDDLERQTATSEVLKVISRSTFDLEPVLETLAENAARLCAADKAFIYRFENGLLNMAVAYNCSAELRDFVERNPVVPGRYSVTSRAAL